jgi:hypothetical protein
MAGNGGVIGPTQTVSAPRPALTTKVTASGCFSPRAATPATVLVVAGGAGGGRQGAGGGGAGGTRLLTCQALPGSNRNNKWWNR